MTPEFEREYEKYVDIAHLLSLEEKQYYWNFCKMDYGNNRVQPYVPYPEMAKVHESKARFKMLALPNRAGKSLAVSAEIVARMCYPKGGVRIWLLAEEYAIADNEWLYFEAMLLQTDLYDEYLLPEISRQLEERGLKGKNPRSYIRLANNHPKRLEIRWPGKECTKSIIEQKSYNNSSRWKKIEGSKLCLAVLAEGATMPKDLWDRHLENRLMDLAGEVWVPTTPKGEDEIFYPWFQKGLSSKMVVDIDFDKHTVKNHMEPVAIGEDHITRTITYIDSFESFQWPGKTSPYYNQDAYKSKEKRLFAGNLDEAIFRESCYGEFTSKTGKFFSNIPDSVFVVNYRRRHDSTQYEGVDIGAASPSVCEWMDVEKPDKNGDETIVIHRELYRPGLWVGVKGTDGYEDTLCGRIQKIRGDEVVQYTAVDRISANQSSANSDKTVEEMMYENGIKVRLPKMPKHQIDWMTWFKGLLFSGRIKICKDSCPELVKEIRLVEYAPTKYQSGRAIQEDSLAKTPIHAITAVLYALYTNLIWVKPEEQIRKEYEANKPQKNSFLAALGEREKGLKANPIYNMIGKF